MQADEGIRFGRIRLFGGTLPLVLLSVACGGLMPVVAPAAGLWDTGFQDEPRRERSEPPGVPTISFIDSPTAQCYGPMDEVDACYVNWGSLEVSATAPQYIERMTIMIDGRIRAYYAGFFQTSMTVPPGMHAEGFKVACGYPGAGGDPAFGNQYAYEIRARETGGLSSANFGSVLCPFDYRIDLIFRHGFE